MAEETPLSGIEELAGYLSRKGTARFPTPAALEERALQEAAKEMPELTKVLNLIKEQKEQSREELMQRLLRGEEAGTISLKDQRLLSELRENEPPLSEKGRKSFRAQVEDEKRIKRSRDMKDINKKDIQVDVGTDRPGRDEMLGIGRAPVRPKTKLDRFLDAKLRARIESTAVITHGDTDFIISPTKDGTQYQIRMEKGGKDVKLNRFVPGKGRRTVNPMPVEKMTALAKGLSKRLGRKVTTQDIKDRISVDKAGRPVLTGFGKGAFLDELFEGSEAFKMTKSRTKTAEEAGKSVKQVIRGNKKKMQSLDLQKLIKKFGRGGPAALLLLAALAGGGMLLGSTNENAA